MKPGELLDHPEGGHFREVFRSSRLITRADGQSRSALTHIYFSLDSGEISRFHRVEADEVWNLYRGSGIRLFLWDGSDALPTEIELSTEAGEFCHVVPAGVWQAAEPIGESVLVGCSVGPGFDFEDFQLIDPTGAEARRLFEMEGNWERFI
ncbi:MAG: cupin domain-containing protein [Verrucomicrobiota bacterium]